MEVNKIYNGDCLEVMKDIPDESIDLIIADPPYWKVVNQKWDYQWRTREEYIEWSKKWINEVYRVLRKGGSFYLFGYFRTLAYLLSDIETQGFEFKQQIIINKGLRAISGRATKNYKIYPNVTESIFFMVKDSKPFIKKFLKERQKELKLTAKFINEELGVKSNGGGMWSIYTGKNICGQAPTKELWEKLSKILNFDYKYEKLAQTFNPQMGFTDVWNDIDFYKENRIHPTQKPLPLIKRLISTSSNPNEIILDPFMGSGSTAIAAINTKRNYIGIEKDLKYFEIANKRIEDYKKQTIT